MNYACTQLSTVFVVYGKYLFEYAELEMIFSMAVRCGGKCDRPGTFTVT